MGQSLTLESSAKMLSFFVTNNLLTSLARVKRRAVSNAHDIVGDVNIIMMNEDFSSLQSFPPATFGCFTPIWNQELHLHTRKALQ
jgi:hypothetical protein